MADLAVRMVGIEKCFAGVHALQSVGFELRRGEVHALAGGNGAGKSTLMKILLGVHQPDAGVIEVFGKPVRPASTRDAAALGIAMIFQEFSVVPTLTVAQNTFLARERRGFLGLLDDKGSVEKTRQLFRHMGVTIDPNERLENLDTAYWQLTEIAKALSAQAKILIMDEPTASLAKEETDRLFTLIRALVADGISVVYISHRIQEILAIADRVTVLRDGKHVMTTEVKSLTAPELVEQIIGHHVEDALAWRPRVVARDGLPLLELRNLHVKPRLRKVSFELYAGEILGLAGLMGSGRSETARALFGIDRIQSGEIKVRGRAVSLRNSRDAISAGIALIPEDRRLQGLVSKHSVRENLLLPLLKRFTRFGWVDDTKGRTVAQTLVARLAIKVANVDWPTEMLSGGNQQKVVLAKWMGTEPSLYIMDEPTAGVDIGTKMEIFGMVRQLADQGKGVVFISSELPELLAVCDRILVLRDGMVERSFEREEIKSEEMLHLAVQGLKEGAHAELSFPTR